MKEKKALKIPNSIVIVFVIMIISAILTYIIPAGQYDVVAETKTIDPNTFHLVERSGTTFWEFINSAFSGMQKSAAIILFTFLVGGYFNVLIDTKAIDAFISSLINKLGNKSIVIIPIIAFIMSILGAVGVMANPVVAVMPVGLILARRLKLDPIMALAMMFVAAYSGFGTSPLSAMTVQTAQKIANIPILSGFGFRSLSWLIIFVVTIIYIMNYAKKVLENKKNSILGEEFILDNKNEEVIVEYTFRHALVLITLVVGLGIYVYGSLKYSWGIEYMAGTMLVVAIVSAFATNMGTDGFVKSFLKGAQQMTFSALLIGLATSISVILTDGNILHTIIYGMSIPLNYLPSWIVAPLMYYINIIFNFFVSSGSGQAAIVMPILAPLSDVVGVTRQMAVSAYQLGDGVSNLIFPTTGTLMACLAIAGVKYNQWIKWMMPLFFIWVVIATALMMIGVFIGIS